MHAALTSQPPSNPIAPSTKIESNHRGPRSKPRRRATVGENPSLHAGALRYNDRVTRIEIQQRFSASPARVFAAVTDHKRLEQWQKGTRVTIEKDGVPPPNGLGAIRKVSNGPFHIYEEIVRWEEPQAMDYRIVRGAPLRDHLGEIRLAPAADGGTLVRYRVRFELPWYAGGRLMERLVSRQLERLITAAYARLAEELR